MGGSFVILTGASGSGKTTLARAIQAVSAQEHDFVFFDSIGVPSADAMKAFGDDHQPGGAWQRAMTLRWMERIAPMLQAGNSVLFEGQMRLAFLREAIEHSEMRGARVILIDCDDATRVARLRDSREQPELANESMLDWARYLREEARSLRYEIMDTGTVPLAECVERIQMYLRSSNPQQ